MGKKSMAYQVSEDDEDSEDEELLKKMLHVMRWMPRSKVAEAQRRASLLGNQELKASDLNNTKVQSFKNRFLMLTPRWKRNRVW